jgi:hypothetical protein
MGSYVFLLLLLALVLAAMIACIVLLRQIDRNTSKAAPKPVAPYVIPRMEAARPRNGFVIPPPPNIEGTTDGGTVQ